MTLDDVTWDSNWEFEFEDQEALYFTNILTKALNEEYGDIEAQIMDTQRNVLLQFENIVIISYLFLYMRL